MQHPVLGLNDSLPEEIVDYILCKLEPSCLLNAELVSSESIFIYIR